MCVGRKRAERAVKGKCKGGCVVAGREWLSVWGLAGESGGWFAFIRTWGERALTIILSGAVLLFIKIILAKTCFLRFNFQYKNKIKAMRRVEHCISACLMWRMYLCGCVDRKCALGESVRSERVAIRRKGGRTVCGRGWGWVCLGACAGFVVRGCAGKFARLCICRKGERVLSY